MWHDKQVLSRCFRSSYCPDDWPGPLLTQCPPIHQPCCHSTRSVDIIAPDAEASRIYIYIFAAQVQNLYLEVLHCFLTCQIKMSFLTNVDQVLPRGVSGSWHAGVFFFSNQRCLSPLCSTGPPPPLLPGVMPGVALPPSAFALHSLTTGVKQDTTSTQLNSTLTNSHIPLVATTCESINITITTDSS